ncbi:MAG: sigma-70 family RNA polymerase sigma factor [Clostridiales bacterium]|nr:sigma-70 family RNA polymerase sigma factor [Clostridiales bacterium]
MAMEQSENSRWYAFFTRDGEKLIRFVKSKARRISTMDAEDIVADVMVSLVSRLESNGSVENIAAYAYRSIRNRIADYERTRQKTVSLDGMADEDGELPLLALIAADNEEPFQAEEQAQRMHRLTDAIGRLEPRQRAVLVATELKGRSFRELSEAWGEPIGTLLSRKSRAVKALRRMLEEDPV